MKLVGILRNKDGETMAEVLVAALVISLATILLVSMIVASQKMISRSEKSFKNYYLKRNELETAPQTEAAGGTVSINGTTDSENKDPIFSVSLQDTTVKVYSKRGGETGGREYSFMRYGTE